MILYFCFIPSAFSKCSEINIFHFIIIKTQYFCRESEKDNPHWAVKNGDTDTHDSTERLRLKRNFQNQYPKRKVEGNGFSVMMEDGPTSTRDLHALGYRHPFCEHWSCHRRRVRRQQNKDASQSGALPQSASQLSCVPMLCSPKQKATSLPVYKAAFVSS